MSFPTAAVLRLSIAAAVFLVVVFGQSTEDFDYTDEDHGPFNFQSWDEPDRDPTQYLKPGDNATFGVTFSPALVPFNWTFKTQNRPGHTWHFTCGGRPAPNARNLNRTWTDKPRVVIHERRYDWPNNLATYRLHVINLTVSEVSNSTAVFTAITPALISSTFHLRPSTTTTPAPKTTTAVGGESGSSGSGENTGSAGSAPTTASAVSLDAGAFGSMAVKLLLQLVVLRLAPILFG